MARLAVFIGGVVFIYLLLSYGRLWWARFLEKRRAQRPSLTMFDVRDLILQGKREEAVQAYAQLFGVTHVEAGEAVEALARSIQDKNV